MDVVSIGRLARRVFALATAMGLVSAGAQAPEPTLRLNIVGGLAGVNQFTRHEEPFWSQQLSRLTAGRASAVIVPFDRAGIRPQEMLRLVHLGAVPFGTVLLNVASLQDPEFAAPDLAGLNPDIASLKRNVAAFRPYLRRTLAERYGAELLAVYTYPAQVIFCTRALSGLPDLKGRRVRTSNPSQSDMVEALGGIPVPTGFAEIVANVRSGNVDCAITGTMSGNTIGLHEVTRYIHGMPINWGIAAFVANTAAWTALPADVRNILQRELPLLEDAIWTESARETSDGIACNVGASNCSGGRKGTMHEAGANVADDARRRELLVNTVLPRWVQRCGPSCAQVWSQTLGPVAGIAIR
jgi:TRAP-type C4-dicarboxylate transport system substrate-binding protein